MTKIKTLWDARMERVNAEAAAEYKAEQKERNRKIKNLKARVAKYGCEISAARLQEMGA